MKKKQIKIVVHRTLLVFCLFFVMTVCTGCNNMYKADVIKQKELENEFGKVNEQGRWIPPEGAYTDQKTGNIKNKDGIVVGGIPQKPHAAYPGSLG